MSWCVPVGSYLAHGVAYRLCAPLEWDVGAKGSGLSVEVPVGFVFDASVPWLLRWFQSPHDPAIRRAACLHDWALSMGWRRVQAAALFEDALRADGVGPWRRLAMTLAVIVWNWK